MVEEATAEVENSANESLSRKDESEADAESHSTYDKGFVPDKF